MTSWLDRVQAVGLVGNAAQLAARNFSDLEILHADSVSADTPTRAWWVPGRIEVLGKHTDYGGGRSLLCTVERGFHIVASPRTDATVRIYDASTRMSVTIALSPDAPSRPGHWTDYPISVVRRIARDFPGASIGMNATIKSSLPSAAGLSSSSALVIASFLPLAAFNNLSARDEWRAIPDKDALAGYMGAVENGRAFATFGGDRGVGTQGGSEDQTAIICSEPGKLLRYHFVPVTPEGIVEFPLAWTFVIGMSGVHAAKGGAVQQRYNALAGEIARILQVWNTATGRHDQSLLAALGSRSDARATLDQLLAVNEDTYSLQPRLMQFDAETNSIVPNVAQLLATGNIDKIGPDISRSQQLAEQVLANQIPETVHLAGRAVALGAVAASAFGAGFGGSVWALIRSEAAPDFLARWEADYHQAFPARRSRAEFFETCPGPAATEL